MPLLAETCRRNGKRKRRLRICLSLQKCQFGRSVFSALSRLASLTPEVLASPLTMPLCQDQPWQFWHNFCKVGTSGLVGVSDVKSYLVSSDYRIWIEQWLLRSWFARSLPGTCCICAVGHRTQCGLTWPLPCVLYRPTPLHAAKGMDRWSLLAYR